jgi:enamine deaminase RidA (YjgF/YER057c/UK114 family)
MVARSAICTALGFLLIATPAASQKKEKLEPTQVLDLPDEPPQAVVAPTDRLVFLTSPLSSKGLLSQQTRDATKALWKAARGAQIVKIRAFVAGSGDIRRVSMVVSEMFSDKRMALPAVTVVQVGSLPLSGAQVVLEAMAIAKKVVNPNGIAFVSGQAGKVNDPITPLKAAIGAMEAKAITCFLASLDQVNSVRSQIAAAYPKAVANYVQLRRDTLGDFVECEAVASPEKAPSVPVEYRSSKEGRYSDVALVGPGKVVISGTQLAFGASEEDMRLAFERLEKALVPVNGKLADAILTRLYPLTSAAGEAARKVRFEYYDSKKPPASTLLVFEGLPSLDALMGMEVVTLFAQK